MRDIAGGQIEAEGLDQRGTREALDHYRRGAWDAAFRSFSAVDPSDALEARNIHRWGESAYLTARYGDCVSLLGRAHHQYVKEELPESAVQAAFWTAITLLFNGDKGQAMGWLGRAQRLLDECQDDCVGRGYVLVPQAEQRLNSGDIKTSLEITPRIVDIARSHGDDDLETLALLTLGRIHLVRGKKEQGLSLLDEAMVKVLSDQLSPRITGLVYCAVLQECQNVSAFDRSREWTDALASWCDKQPELLSFTGACMVHRAEVMQLSGEWNEAIEEVARACERFKRVAADSSEGAARYVQGEIYRLRGEESKAEDSFRHAAELSIDPQPGLALLRLAQGKSEQALATIGRLLETTEDRWRRSRILPAAVEAYLESSDHERARACASELRELATEFEVDALQAAADHATGSVATACGNAREGAAHLSRAIEAFRRLRAPFDEACSHLDLASAYQALGDADSAAIERSAAESIFNRLGAEAEFARRQSSVPGVSRASDVPAGITPRELEILKWIATGLTNKAIATELGLSVKTVDRHLSNIFTKIDVATRAEATAFAFRNKLVDDHG